MWRQEGKAEGEEVARAAIRLLQVALDYERERVG